MGFDFDLPDEANDAQSEGSDEPSFGDNMAPPKFRRACEEYADWAVKEYDTFDGVDLSDVPIEVSTAMKRTAGKAIDKTGDFLMRFAYAAYEKWGWEEFKSTIRHELIHIKQLQEKGSGDHGTGFEIMAEEVDCSKHCEVFSDFKYGVFCSDCKDMVAGRFQMSKMVKKAEKYRSKCCDAECYSEKL
jgi:predicted SprT family Zn-dependent metalloprotease